MSCKYKYKGREYNKQELIDYLLTNEYSLLTNMINDPQNVSKVVDENGQPLLTWHNSKNRFNEFRKTKGKRTSLAGVAEVESSGFFFAKDKKFATAYGDVVYPSFLNIRNVFDISQGDGRQQDLYKKVVGRDMVSDMPFGIETAWEYFDGDEFDISNDIIKNNFDGVNIYEKSPENSDLYSDVFITFNPNQIKSATENVGTFSTDSNDIRYQIIGEQGASRMVEYKQQLDRAKELEKEGKTPAQIELETGWYKYKGDWRTIPKEVVESFQIKDRTVNKELTLKQVLGDDSTIFSFYPEISGAKVVFLGENYKNNAFEEAKKQTFGFVDEKTGTIYINMATTNPSTGDREDVTQFNQLKTLEQAVKNLIQESAQKDLKETVEEVINKLKQTGLSSEVFQLNTAQLQEKLKELGVGDDIAMQVSMQIKNGYYSNAQTAFTNLKDKNVKNVQGWLKALTDVQKNGGVKNVNQELEWIGLEDFLNEYIKENNPKNGNIPASVVEEYILSNQIEIVDVSKEDYLKPVPLTFNKLNEFDEDDYGSTISSYETIEEVYEDDEVGYQIVKTDEGYYVRDERTDNVYRDGNYENNLFSTFEEAVRIAGLHLADKNKTSVEGTKYEGYQLKGGENYREILLTMPDRKREVFGKVSETLDYARDNYGINSAEYKSAKKSLIATLEDEMGLDYDVIEDLFNMYEESPNAYKSSHWDEANILAHVRMNEKTLPDGRRVLILNEIQADISQDLKKEQDKILDRVDKGFDNFLDNLIMNKVVIEEC